MMEYKDTKASKAISFWYFIQEHPVEIPIIQRDYAQGRLGAEYLRYNFLTNLKQALDNKLPNGAKVLTLDFVYGAQNKENAKLYPLDGQQRLTTLWLLHWYVALRAGKLNDVMEGKNKRICDVLRNFTYETRISSREFCGCLCNADNFKTFDGKNIIDFITSQTWFYSVWKQDPTIQSMLRMLGGTKVNNKAGEDITDGIEELFDDTDNFDDYWNSLSSDNTPIIFYYLPLTDFGLSDDLYIKMNARGKQLTSFENFKADLVEYIVSQAAEDNKWEKLLDPENGIAIKLDTTWTDLFWQEKRDYKIDEIYFAFLNRFFLNRIMLRDSSEKEIETDRTYNYLYGDDSNDSKLLYNSFDVYKFEELYDALNRLTITLNNFAASCCDNSKISKDKFDEIKVAVLPSWKENDVFCFIPQYKEDTITTLKQAQRVVFHAVCKYFEIGTYDESSFKRWMRVVWNIVENSNTTMIGCLKLIDEIGEHCHDIYAFLAADGCTVKSNAAKEQLAEEMEKARQILKSQDAKLPEKPNDWNEEKAWDWEMAIIEAEGYAFFNGAIRFLFRNKNGEWDWKGFSKKWENAQTLFGDNGLYKNKSALLRYFISKFTQWDLFCGITFDNAPSSWRYSLLNGKWNGPVDEVLRSSGFEVGSDYRSIFDGKQKAVQEELVISNLLDYIERGCHLNCRNDNIYILYPYNAKADWKKYIIADKRNKILSSLYSGSIDQSSKQSGKIYTNQKIEGCEFFWGWNIHFIYVIDDAEYAFCWQHWNCIDMYDGDKKLYEDNNELTINGNGIKDEVDLIEKMNQCIDRYRNPKRNADQPN